MQSDDDCSERGIAFDASFFIFYSISGKQKSQGGFAEKSRRVCRDTVHSPGLVRGACTEPVRYRSLTIFTLRNLSKRSIIVCTYVLTARETAGKSFHRELPLVLLS